MAANRGYMAFQSLCAFFFAVGVLIILESLERNLGINHHVALVGKMKNNIGNHSAPRFVVFYYVAIVVS